MIDFKRLFSKWSYGKEESEKLFEEKVKKFKYDNGSLVL